MPKVIKLKKGFNINLAGKAEKKIAQVSPPETFAIKPTDFAGLKRAKLLVNEGDNVKAGTPILFNRQNENVMITAPVSGEVVEIKRGEKRRLLEIRILADKEIEYLRFDKYTTGDIAGLEKEKVKETMIKSGVWPNILQRPYGIVADPEDEPKAIFISAFDTHPLAPDYNFIFQEEEKYFQAGIDILKKFTAGKVHLNSDAEEKSIFSETQGVQVNTVSGPHPAGNVGIQIHHIDPISKGDIAWTINPHGVIQIGKLFIEGQYDTSRIIALTGSEVREPQYYRLASGASIKNIVESNLNSNHVRYISGNVLTGERIAPDGCLGFYDHMVTVIKEGDYYEMLGWLKPTTNKLSFHRAFGLLSFLNPKREYVLDTNTRGEERAFVMTGAFERVTPMDIYPTHLIKAILAEDFDDMEALGIYEVIEEDLALCEFIDVSKHDIQAILREGIELIQNS